MKFLLLFITITSVLLGNENPVEIKVQKQKGQNFKLTVSVPKGYAIQKDAPNKITLTGDKSLEVVSSDTKFKGNTILDKPEYFSKVEDMKLVLKGKGELTIDSRIFYCDLNKNVCYPAKISKKEKIL
ncbi:MAG: hypothetical protein SFU98_03535 [Leptospiraceae bacterium]|nr:hypothetical protein [Leptospiraceae bacterium]